MDSREFVRLLKHEGVDSVVSSILRKLKSPRQPQATAESDDPIQRGVTEFINQGARVRQQQAAWFRQLSDEQQRVLINMLEECAELSALSVCTLIDGVGGNYEGTLELSAVDSKGKKTRLNPENSEMLHDLLSDVLEEERKD
jgi:hypothetical protein